jgi:hypothetical protein
VPTGAIAAGTSPCRSLGIVALEDIRRSVNQGEPKALDLVLDYEFAALEFDNLEIVDGAMLECIVQFVFQNFVFPFQFNEMRLNRH